MSEIVVPWRAGCPYRERAWGWVRPRLERLGRVTEAVGPSPWCKAAAVMPAVAACGAGEIVVVADADVWSDGIMEAVAAVEAGAPWAIPHRLVHRLTEASTASVLAGAEWRAQPLCQKPYPGIPGGGIVVARREVMLSTPLDAHFTGWG